MLQLSWLNSGCHRFLPFLVIVFLHSSLFYDQIVLNLTVSMPLSQIIGVTFSLTRLTPDFVPVRTYAKLYGEHGLHHLHRHFVPENLVVDRVGVIAQSVSSSSYFRYLPKRVVHSLTQTQSSKHFPILRVGLDLPLLLSQFKSHQQAQTK
jgi:hypothetical protein